MAFIPSDLTHRGCPDMVAIYPNVAHDLMISPPTETHFTEIAKSSGRLRHVGTLLRAELT